MRQRGFTLLEVLIAIAIFALLAMATYRMLDSVLQTDRGQRQQEQRLRELTRAMAAFERDLLQVRTRPIRDPLGDPLASLYGDSGKDTRLEFTRSGWRNPLGQQGLEGLHGGISENQQVEHDVGVQHQRACCRRAGLRCHHWRTPAHCPGAARALHRAPCRSGTGGIRWGRSTAVRGATPSDASCRAA